MFPPDDTRFDSWKEIAAYLGHDLRTVRRWEQERALPVHRVPGGGRRSVYAFRREIDAWLLKANEVPTDNAGRLVDTPANSRTDPATVIANSNGNGTVSPTLESKPVSQHLRPTNPLRFGALSRTVLFAVTAVLGIGLVWLIRPRLVSITPDPRDEIDIASVSPILPQRDQEIVIRGTGFGMHTPYMHTDSPFLAFRDKTAGWAAGRIIPQNWDEIMVDVKSWEDTKIVLSGFSGSYGGKGWKLSPGDRIEIAIWNPQSGRGPAVYHLTVSPTPTE